MIIQLPSNRPGDIDLSYHTKINWSGHENRGYRYDEITDMST